MKSINAGQSNQSYLLTSDNAKLVLRLNNSESLLPFENREHESRIWQMASAHGVSPPLLYVDTESRFFISSYIENQLPSEAPFRDSFVNQALTLLEKCHRLDIKAPKIDYKKHLQNYWQQLESRNLAVNPDLQNQREPMQTILNQLGGAQTPTALCHHDPIPANFVGTTGRLYLIDWEYASIGLPIMDYAALAVEWNLEDKTVLDRTSFNPSLFQQAKSFYNYTCRLWQALNQ